ncbi:MAG: hypothetical protein WC627_08030 [Legionella sp.]
MNYQQTVPKKQKFFFFSSLIILLYFLVSAAIPIWNYLVLDSYWDSWYQTLGYKKLQVLFILGLCFMFLELVLFLKGVNKHNKWYFLAVLVGSWGLLLLVYLNVFAQVNMKNQAILELSKYQVNYERLKSIKIVNLPSIDDQRIFNKQFLLDAEIKSDEDFYAVVNQQYNVHRKYLIKIWGVKNEELLQTLFFMNLVSNMWAYGNKIDTLTAGCVQSNEDTKHIPISAVKMKDIQTFIKTNIGCCNDSAYLMRLLLTRAKIKNRLVLVPGHVFNEAFINNKWMAFDATTNLWWHSSWKQIQAADITKPFTVSIFPHSNLVANTPYYRKAAGNFQLFLLLNAAYKLDKDISHPLSI